MRVSDQNNATRCGKPKRYKLALLTFLGLLAPVYLIPPALAEALSAPRLLLTAVAVAVIVMMMTYIIMPALKYLSAGGLCERPDIDSRG